MKNSILISILLSTISISCVSTKQYQVFTHEKEINLTKARIYVMRPSSMLGASVKTSIFCNDVLIGNTGNDSYLCWDVPEGVYTIGTTQFAHAGITLGAAAGEDVFVVKATAGKIYYIKQYPRFGGFAFELLNQKKGEKAIKRKKSPKLNYVE